MKAKIKYILTQEYEMEISEELKDLEVKDFKEAAKYYRQNIEYYGDDRLSVLMDSTCKRVHIKSIEEE